MGWLTSPRQLGLTSQTTGPAAHARKASGHRALPPPASELAQLPPAVGRVPTTRHSGAPRCTKARAPPTARTTRDPTQTAQSATALASNSAPPATTLSGLAAKNQCGRAGRCDVLRSGVMGTSAVWRQRAYATCSQIWIGSCSPWTDTQAQFSIFKAVQHVSSPSKINRKPNKLGCFMNLPLAAPFLL